MALRMRKLWNYWQTKFIAELSLPPPMGFLLAENGIIEGMANLKLLIRKRLKLMGNAGFEPATPSV